MKRPIIRPTNITIICLISFFSALYFYLPILTLYLQQRGLNFLQINSLWGIIVGTMFLAEVPTGIVADKIGRKPAITIALALQFMGEVIYIFAEDYWLFALVSVIAGLGFAFASGCVEAFIYDTLKQEGRAGEMARIAGIYSAFAQAAFTIGPLIGGFLAADLSLQKFILLIKLTAASVAVGLLLSFWLKEPRSEKHEAKQSSLKLLASGLTLIQANKSLRKIILLSVFAGPFLDYLLNLYPPYFLQANVPSIWLGLAFSLGSVVALLASKYAYRAEEIFGVKKGMLMATALPGLFYFLMAIIFQPILSVGLFVFAWGSMKLKAPLLAQYQNSHIESENRATVLSLISMVSGLYIALIGLLIGRLADYSLSYSFLFMGAMVLLGSFLFRIDESHVAKPV